MVDGVGDAAAAWPLDLADVTAPEVAALARHANTKVTVGLYAGLTDEGRERAAAKLAEDGFGG